MNWAPGYNGTPRSCGSPFSDRATAAGGAAGAGALDCAGEGEAGCAGCAGLGNGAGVWAPALAGNTTAASGMARVLRKLRSISLIKPQKNINAHQRQRRCANEPG